MRILKLQFTNLNSLAGTWCIDFTHPAFTGGGIFAITGPTGAGKSTILDAICLALYGRTPRLKSVTKNENEIMSRLTAGCSSEVTFQTVGGVYRCTWAQKLARGKIDGNRQEPTHEIVDVLHGNAIIASQIRTVAAKIEEITGMDFAQFTRSMLLAQGSFASFLQADAGGRAPVLEQITGTEIYSRISVHVYERCAGEKKLLDDLGIELDVMKPMSAEEHETVHNELHRLKADAAGITERASALRSMLAWFEAMEKLEHEIDLIDGQWREFNTRNAAAGTMREKLHLARQSASIEQFYAPLRTLRVQLAENRTSLAAAAERLPAMERTRDAAALTLHREHEALEAAKLRLGSGSELWKRVRRLDASIAEKRQRSGEIRESMAAVARETEKLTAAIAEQQRALDLLRTKKIDLQKYFSEFASDAALVGSMSMIDKMAEDLRARTVKREQVEAFAAAAAKAAIDTAEDVRSMETECAAVRTKTEAAAALCAARAEEIRVLLNGSDIGAYRASREDAATRASAADEALTHAMETAAAAEALAELEKETGRIQEGLVKGRGLVLDLERELQAKQAEAEACEREVFTTAAIQNLDAQRSHLVDGEPCPLCGAREHPFSHEKPQHADGMAARLKTLKAEVQQLVEKLNAYRVRIGKLETDLTHCEEKGRDKKELLATHSARCSELCASLGIGTAGVEIAAEGERMRSRKIELQALIADIEKRSGDETRAAKEHDALKALLHEAEKKLKDAQFAHTQAGADEKRFAGEAVSVQAEIDTTITDITAAVSPFGITEVAAAAMPSVCTRLRARLDAWTQKAEERDAIGATIDALFSEKKTNEAVNGKYAVQTAAIEAELAVCEADRTVLEQERTADFGTKDPDAEERALNASIRELELSVANHRDAEAAAQNDVLEAKTRIRELTQQGTRLDADVLDTEKQFTANLSAAGFGSEDAFMDAVVPREEREELQRQIDALRDEETRLESLRAQKRQELKREQEKALSAGQADDLRLELSRVSDAISLSQQAIGSLEQRIKDNEALVGARADRERTYALRKKEYERWSALNELIGSASGKKFQKIAQAITFERMIALANGVLTKMSPRYVLLCDEKTDLEMNIVDMHQAGEVRSTKNLSGGESFIVSLSLALGLSQMASRNVRVDSLFLDEGFGTLDEDALDIALTTLSELQQDGKCIGVISHVGALKERIATQIVVTPDTGGRSKLSGPGCAMLQ